MVKRIYESPTLEIVSFEPGDTITTSGATIVDIDGDGI